MNDINRELFQLEPYMMIAPSSSNTSRGVQYVGFVADIVRKLSEVVGFRYELYVAPDNNYGYRKSDGTWNGMVKELLSKVSYPPENGLNELIEIMVYLLEVQS